MSNSKEDDDLDIFLKVRKRKSELINSYRLICFERLKNEEFSSVEIFLNSLDNYLIQHYLNLFLNDKQLLHEFLYLYEDKLSTLSQLSIAKSLLESYEFILLNLSKEATFTIKVIIIYFIFRFLV